jgi:hypothetical protein
MEIKAFNTSNLNNSWTIRSLNNYTSGNTDFSRASGIEANADGFIWVTGTFYDTLSAGNFGVNSPYSNSYNQNAFVMQLNPSGNVNWISAPLPDNSNNNSIGHSVATDGYFGNVYYAGKMYGKNNFGPLSANLNLSSFFLVRMGNVGLSVAENNLKAPDFSVFPNPARQSISIQPLSAQAVYSIHDLSGRCIISFSGSALTSQPIDLSFCSPGMYLMTKLENGSLSRQKFMIAR